MRARQWQDPFIEAIGRGLDPGPAAELAGVERSTPYHARRRDPDGFGERWRTARARAAEKWRGGRAGRAPR